MDVLSQELMRVFRLGGGCCQDRNLPEPAVDTYEALVDHLDVFSLKRSRH